MVPQVLQTRMKTQDGHFESTSQNRVVDWDLDRIIANSSFGEQPFSISFKNFSSPFLAILMHVASDCIVNPKRFLLISFLHVETCRLSRWWLKCNCFDNGEIWKKRFFKKLSFFGAFSLSSFHSKEPETTFHKRETAKKSENFDVHFSGRNAASGFGKRQFCF